MMMSEITNPNPCLHTCLSIVDFSTASAKMFRRTKDSIVSGGDDSCFELNWIEPDQWSTFCANFVAQAARKLHQIIYFLYSVEGKGVEWQKCQEKNVNVFMLTCNTLSSENIKTQKNVVLVSSCREANYDKSRDKIPSPGRCSFLPLFPWFAKLSAKSKKDEIFLGIITTCCRFSGFLNLIRLVLMFDEDHYNRRIDFFIASRFVHRKRGIYCLDSLRLRNKARED